MPEELKSKLLPCPVCSGTARSQLDEEMPRWMVECQTCGLVKFAHSKWDAEKAWNTRPVSELERLAREVAESHSRLLQREIGDSFGIDLHRTQAPYKTGAARDEHKSAIYALVAYLGY